MKWSVILTDRLGPDNFSTLRMKGHVLHRARNHLKVPSWSLFRNMRFRLKSSNVFVAFEWNYRGCEKILPISGYFKEFEVFWNGGFYWAVVRVNGILLLFSFWECWLHDDQFVGRYDGPLEQQKQDSNVCRRNHNFPQLISRKSKKLRIRNSILDMRWMWRWIKQITMRICGFVVHWWINRLITRNATLKSCFYNAIETQNEHVLLTPNDGANKEKLRFDDQNLLVVFLFLVAVFSKINRKDVLRVSMIEL